MTEAGLVALVVVEDLDELEQLSLRSGDLTTRLGQRSLRAPLTGSVPKDRALPQMSLGHLEQAPTLCASLGTSASSIVR